MALVALGALTLGFADDISVDAEIEAIQSAPAQERVRLMNEFKEKLSLMNQEDRGEAISKLQAKTQTQTQERVQEMQMNNVRDMSQAQSMSQQQAGNQFAQEPGSMSGGGMNKKMGGR